MKWVAAWSAALGVFLAAGASGGQEIPEMTPEQQKLVNEILAAGLKDGGLSLGNLPTGAGKFLQVADEKKVRATLAARRPRLTPALREGLLSAWDGSNEESRPAIVALMRGLAEETKDDHALGLTAFLTAKGLARQQRVEEVIRAYTQARGHFERAGQPVWQAASLNNLGFALQTLGRYTEAADSYLKALEIRRKLYPASRFPNGQTELAISLSTLGSIRRAQGQYTEAEDYHRQALAMLLRLYPASRHPDGHPLLAKSLDNLAVLMGDQGRQAEATGYHHQALKMLRKLYPPSGFPDGQLDLAISLNNLGSVLEAQGQYEEAHRHHREALELLRALYPPSRFPNGSPYLARSLNNLATLLLSRGEHAEAERRHREALRMWRQLYPASRYPGGHPDLAQSLNNLGFLLQSLGHPEDAVRTHAEALEMRRKLYPAPRYPGGHPDLAQSLNNSGFALKARGRYAEAEAEYGEALQALRAASARVDLDAGPDAAPHLRVQALTALVLRNRAILLAQRLPERATVAQVRRAERSHALALALHDRLRGEVLRGEKDRLEHGENADRLLPQRVGLLARLFALEGRQEDLPAAFHAIEQGRARVFLESLGEAHAGALAGLPDSLRLTERQLSLAIREIDARVERLQNRPGDEAARQVRQLYADRLKLEAEEKAFVERLRKSHPRYAGFRYPAPCGIKDARECLGDSEVALLFTVGIDVSHVLLVERTGASDKRERSSIFQLPGAKELDAAVGTLLSAEALQRPAFLRDRAAELHRKVLGPLGDRIDGKALVIVPDGALCLLPFELLVEGQTEEDDGHYLIEKHRIRYAPSLTTLHLSRQADAARAGKPMDLLWALADPIFDSKDPRNDGKKAVSPGPLWAGGATFPRLRHSAAEAEAVRKALNVSADKVFQGARAGEAHVKASSTSGDLSRARFVHFATHGIVDERSALGTGLVLNLIGNDEREELGGVNDGFLRLPEVTFLNLNAEVVVLSACETGRGRRNRGEGISGLARAFLYAGSRGVVCSLWSVDDARTAELMADFYKGLKEEKPTGEALRKAQLRMIRAGRAPFFWAPFVLMGE